MTDTPWVGDACSLVDAFRSGERTPLDELDVTLAAIERSDLNAFSYLDPEAARDAAARADLDAPFGGVPVGVKELDSVAGWPYTQASVPLQDEVATHDSALVRRVRDAGAVLVGLTTSSEFGGVNLTRTNLNGATRNPWDLTLTPGGSTGGGSAAVAGGLVTVGTGGDGEAGLGTHELRGKRAAIVPDLGIAVVHPDVTEMVATHGEALARDAGLELVDVPVKLPELGYEWALSGLSEVLAMLGDRYPDCEPDLTLEIGFGLKVATEVYNLEARARIENRRTAMNEAMADVFDEVDFVIAATNPDVAFAAEGPLPTQVGDQQADLGNNGALTIPANVFGSPACSIPIGRTRGLPVGLQVLGRHFEEPLLLEMALIAERERPWPLVAAGSPV